MYRVYENVLDDNIIDFIKNNSHDDESYHQGKVGTYVNPKQKMRKDLFFNSMPILSTIDNYIYDKLYTEIKETFDVDIIFREVWKVGYYDSDDGGFYNLHTDDARETKYRKVSMVCALSDPSDYEGGLLHFPALKKEFKLNKGSIIVFESKLMHGVTPITKGRRYVLVSFFFNNQGRTIREHVQKIPENCGNWVNKFKPLLRNTKLYYPIDKAKLVLGDIDYSDVNEHHWTDEDDYIYEDNDSKTLFISFAGMGFKGSIPTFNFYNFMKQYKNVDKLFLRDTGPPGSKCVTCRYYLLGFRHDKWGLENGIALVRKLINQKSYDRIVAFGCSAGGYAAILYGQILNFHHTIVFNPQTVLTTVRDDFGDIYNAPQNAKYLRTLRKDSPLYQKALDLTNYVPFRNKVVIHYSKSSSSGVDKKHAEYVMKCDNCELIEHDSQDHLLALELKYNGELKGIIDTALC